MISNLDSNTRKTLDQMSGAFASKTGYPNGFSGLIQDMLTAISDGNIGIQSDAGDVDSLALGGGHFSWDEDGTAGLTFAYKAGRINWLSAIVAYGAGTLTLSPSNTNYIEADRNGTVYFNTGGFTANRAPLYIVEAGVSSLSQPIPAKDLITAVAPAGIIGSLLSPTASTITIEKSLVAVAATASFPTFIAPCTGVVTLADFNSDTVVGADNANYWTWTLVNLGQANAGAQALLANTAANTTKTTGGSALAINVPRALTLAGTSLAVNKGDRIVATLTKTGAPTTIANANLSLDFGFNN